MIYDDPSAFEFYRTVWGGEHIHVGIYDADKSISKASARTVRVMASRLESIGPPSLSVVLDLGSGFGGTARQLSKEFNCRVIALDVSFLQSQYNAKLTRDAGLRDRISVVTANFEAIPLQDESVDIVWSQEAFLHSKDRDMAVGESARVLRNGGEFVLTDPMRCDHCNDAEIEPLLERLQLKSLASPTFYMESAERHGLQFKEFCDLSPHLTTHYQRVLDGLRIKKRLGDQRMSLQFYDRMDAGLDRWVQAGRRGLLSWGIFHFRKPPNP